MAETLNSGDLGTAFAKWLGGSTMDLGSRKDINTKGRDLLAAHYTNDTVKDYGFLLSKYLRRAAP